MARMTAAEKAQRAAQRARLDEIANGLHAEVVAFNRAITGGKEVRFPMREGSIASGKQVHSARYCSGSGLWVECANYGGSFCLGNDGNWADLLALAGVTRDPRAC